MRVVRKGGWRSGPLVTPRRELQLAKDLLLGDLPAQASISSCFSELRERLTEQLVGVEQGDNIEIEGRSTHDLML
jgi:hypothetical protein